VNPDPERLGGLAWTRRGGGRLTGAERRRLLAAIAKGQAENLIGRARLALGRLPTGARDVDVRRFEPPDSRLARDAEEACAEQPESIAEHSYRTWMFGLALAAVDRVELDRELFYCAALLDAICVHTTPGIRVDRDGPLGCYIQWGAMVDGAGLRIWDIAHANVQEIVSRHPRGSGFKRELTSMMKAEAAAVPGGRFSLLVRCGLPLAVRLAPFDD
jgi:hypothetical protein